MRFKVGQSCEIITSDSQWTIGYVASLPAKWEGNMKMLSPKDKYNIAFTGEEFFDDKRIYRVNDSFGIGYLPEKIDKWIPIKKLT